MTNSIAAQSFTSALRFALPAIPVLMGLLALYGPAYIDFFGNLWQQPDQAHAPLIPLVVAALFWQLGKKLAALSDHSALPAAGDTLATSAANRLRRPLLGGSLLFGFGLAMALMGRSIESPFLILLSQIPVLAGVLWLLWGGKGVQVAWFPLLFLIFMVPLPGVFIDPLTEQLKQWISILTEEILYALGYPIARSGVVLSIGQYQLLVADACSGLNSMISLSGLGLLYVYMTRQGPWRQQIVMLFSLLPIAFAANLIRVLLLVLLTYHFGDHIGRLLHEATGVVVFLIALLLLFGLDALIVAMRKAARRRSS